MRHSPRVVKKKYLATMAEETATKEEQTSAGADISSGKGKNSVTHGVQADCHTESNDDYVAVAPTAAEIKEEQMSAGADKTSAGANVSSGKDQNGVAYDVQAGCHTEPNDDYVAVAPTTAEIKLAVERIEA